MPLIALSNTLPSEVLTQSYSSELVLLSIVIAIISSFTSFGIAERVRATTDKRHKAAWIIFGSFIMGTGVWAMHFIGMLALTIPIPVTYNLSTTILSMVPVIISCSLVFLIIKNKTITFKSMLLGGLLLGTGIGLMHYIGMGAMQMNATIIYNTFLFYLSLIIAVLLATLALKINQLSTISYAYKFINIRQVLSSIAMGLAISGMHYISMISTSFVPKEKEILFADLGHQSLWAIVLITVLVIIISAIFIPILYRYKELTSKLKILSTTLEETLQKSLLSFGDIFENSLTEIYIFDAESYKFIKINHGACKNIGYSMEELNELTPLDITPKLTLNEFNALIKPLLSGKAEIIHFITTHQRKNGTVYPVEVHLQMSEFLSRSAFVAIILNISDKQEAEKKLELSEKVFSNTSEGIIITDSSGIIIDVNPAFCEITGYSRDEVLGKSPRMLTSGKQSPDFYSNMWKDINKHGRWKGEIWNRTKKGALYAELLSISPIVNDSGEASHYVGIFSDITQSKKQQEILEQIAHYDALTKLPNRVLLADRFSQALARSKRKKSLLAVCFMDLDHFKPVNDLYGHEVGDQLLVEVAKRIKAVIREEDTASRQGGDEFVLLLDNIQSTSHCEQMIKRIINAISTPYLVDDQSIVISASIGVSLHPIDESDLDTLVRHADQAMYQAKLEGRNRYKVFNTQQDQIYIKKNLKLKEIRYALENNELCLYYQPKVNMVTGKVFGAEALIRWNHPEKGLIPPLDFLPIIEETELEIEIGNWVINEALAQLEHWKKQGIELEISVNVSSYHLLSPLFIDQLEKTLSLYPKIYSKLLQLEILESSALGDISLISQIIKTCTHTLGVTLALDDFGTGYSSLTHLRNLPTKIIKVDQTFVRDILDDPSDYAIIDSVIGLSDSFNRDVIAEGVETTLHGLILLAMGCKLAQGYGIAKPMPSKMFPEWLSHYIPNAEWENFASKPHTEKEKRIKIFRLTIAQWKKHFEKSILSSTSNTNKWPILKSTNCHCGVWIKRVKQERLFEEKWLVKLEDQHNIIHSIADDLFNIYQQGQLEAARRGLNNFQIAIEDILNILGQCE